ncbi:MAG: LicD family protein [Dysgonamonadaceae bacterium]|nr:LicD family protein [Dysgonamonadaceae bacterium]
MDYNSKESQEDLSQYNPEGSVLRKAQRRMLEILVEFDRVCRKNNIPYWLSAGTLLGAKRHGGFIPWDDDIDVLMLKKDSKRLVRALERDLSPQFRLQNRKTDKNYCFFFAKIRDTKSQIIMSDDNESKFDYKYKGLYIDVLPIVPKILPVKLKKLVEQHIIYRYELRKNSKDKFHRFLNSTLILLYPFYYLCTYIPAYLGKFLGLKNYAYPPGVFFSNVRRIDEIFPLSKITFEGIEFNAPHNVDAYLTRLYGDYMKIPPKGHRETHLHDIEIED